MIWGYGSWRIKQVDQIVSASWLVRVTVVQGNIEQPKKWDLAFQDETVDIYLRLSCSGRASSPDLVVWPETATPFYLFNDQRLTEKVLNGIRCIDADFLIGSPSFELRDDRTCFYNSAYLLSVEGKVLGKYDKAHLVPFGEYVPLKKWLPFLGKIVEQVGDFAPGEKGRTLSWKGMHLGVQVCYEIIFPELSRSMAGNKAAFLINLTNDAWYGYSSAPYQHFSMTIFRAVENRRPLIRSANTGISGFVDPAGRVLMKSPIFKEAVLTSDLPVLRVETVYTRFGNLFAVVCLIAAAAFGLGQILRERTR
jgi:apolipoprotein N-acyltransferase